ncbi:MAG: DUF3800 domain-containing protein [candidate division Zixibacteria bacterium HGW-Zixibacteria-1]|nr:MAG: DUF3800 domain-containing protein [candidate division Zixibacteria bacterium HGW-Zixibacteria-1]
MRKGKKLREKAERWVPNPNDPSGDDKKLLVEFLLKHCDGYKNAISIGRVLQEVRFKDEYTRELLQHRIIVPLREENDLFIGTSNKGIFLINDADDAYKTISFYTNRIRAEKKHLRNLKKIAKKNELFKSFNIDPKRANKIKKYIYLDESGVPSLKNMKTDPYFIVGALVLDGTDLRRQLARKLAFIKDLIGKPKDYELKSTRLNEKQYADILRELSIIDYEFAAICFIKDKLTGHGFSYPKSFYKYAYDFLINDVFDDIGEVNLYFDEYGGVNTKFQAEFF